MSEKKQKNQDQELERVQSALSASEAFIEKYKNQILYVLGGVVLLSLIIISFKSFYVAPREQEASEKIAVCQEFFAKDSFALALRGDGTDEILGFENIALSYSFTKTAKLAQAYAGVCYFHLGEFENAISALKKVDLNSVNLAPAMVGLIGDCYVELGKEKEALNYFLKAAKEKNDLTAPIFLKKAGVIYEKNGEYAKALEVYTTIKDVYFNSFQATDIDKYIERVKVLK